MRGALPRVLFSERIWRYRPRRRNTICRISLSIDPTKEVTAPNHFGHQQPSLPIQEQAALKEDSVVDLLEGHYYDDGIWTACNQRVQIRNYCTLLKLWSSVGVGVLAALYAISTLFLLIQA
jgi:hypothetical protein